MAHNNELNTWLPVWNYSFFSEQTVRDFQNGEMFDAYKYFGPHKMELENTKL